MTTKKALTRERILATAGQMMRRDGIDSVSVSKVMKASGLTHGGFYAHFTSHDDLITQSLIGVCQQSKVRRDNRITSRLLPGQNPLTLFISEYLSADHLAALERGDGCPLASLSSSFAHLPDTAKPVAQQAIAQQLTALMDYGNLTPQQAFMLSGSLIGALQLARGCGQLSQATDYLAATRDALIATYCSL